MAAWQMKALRLEVAVSAWHEQRVLLGTQPAVGGDFQLIGGALRGCFDPSEAQVTLAPCAAVEIERVGAHGYGDLSATAGSAAWVRGGAAAIGVWRLSDWIALRALLEGTAPFARPAFVADGTSANFRTRIVSFRGSLGFELTIL
jgi:hypothetical protein